jgi:hypothetical protein
MSKSIDDSEAVIKNLSKLLMNSKTSDFTIILEDSGCRLPVHSQILSCSSSYFTGLLYGPYVEGSSRELRISDMEKEPFESLLKYMYTGKLEVRINQIVSLLQAAERFLVTDAVLSLIKITNEYIEELDSSESSFQTICELLSISHSNNNEKICEMCLEFIDENTEAFLQSEAVLSLSEELMTLVIERDTLFDGLNEVSLYLACLRWARGSGTLDPGSQENFEIENIQKDQLEALSRIVNHVRLAFIEPKYIIGFIEKSQLFSYKKLFDALAFSIDPESCLEMTKINKTQRIGSQKPWVWDEERIGNNVLLSSDKTLAIAHHHNWEKVVGNVVWHAGVHLFQVFLDLNISVSSNLWQIIVGVARPDTPLDEHLGAGLNEWGLACYSGHKIFNRDRREEYSSGCSKGDILQVKLDLHRRTLEYFKNGESLGIAFQNLSGPVSPAVSLLKGQRVRLIWD